VNIQPSVLIVEDEDDIAELLRFGLSRAGFATVWAKDLASARAAVKKALPDVVILDWMLPDGEGVAWLTELRRDQRCATLPILMLTARAQESDKLRGLEGGADDYITKPFSPKELIARINTVLRRTAPQHIVQIIPINDCGLSDDDHTHTKNDGSLSEALGNTEFKLLKYLITHPNKSYSRAQLLDYVWGDHIYIEERTVDVHILRLRKILQRFGLEQNRESVRGIGYRWTA
jgi:two-component system phosphate regulon response regulator PhoB